MGLTVRSLALLVFMASVQPVGAADYLVDGVPLPSDAHVAALAESAPAAQRQWAGAWVGAWDGKLKHILLVEAVAEDGTAPVVYAIGDNPLFRIRRMWVRRTGTISGTRLTIGGAAFSAVYDLTDTSTLKATYTRGNISSRATMTRADLASLLKPGAVVNWTRGKSELVQTDLVEGGKPIRLEVVIFKPPGTGPFPLAVINHGSTGRGDNPALFTETWVDLGLADFVNERGWMVAFPQRRGRGKSDGLYDEGFSEIRAEGYTCNAERSLAGADRALHDIEAAVAALQRRGDVAPGAIVIGGQSRGGVLSVAYAGHHPEQVLGVVNFVGGWLGDDCTTAKVINETLFEQGARFPGPTLWLYGRGDRFYSGPHSEANFAAFQKAGGKGTFLEFDVAGGNGHALISHPELWSSTVGQYLDALKSAQKK